MRPLANYIDHTLLAADTTEEQIKLLCAQAIQYGFYSVCINTSYIPLAKTCLKESNVKICCVIDFPFGAGLTVTKAFEAAEAICQGAQEVDMVINIGMLKSGHIDFVKQDIAAVKAACGDTLLKVILETCLLTDDEVRLVCKMCLEIGVEFVKTSTGYSTEGATVHHVALMRQAVGNEMGVKASGAVRDTQTALQMIEAGATRIGASASIDIVTNIKTDKLNY